MTDFRPGGFQVLPMVVKNLIIINVLMVLIQFALGRYGINLGDYLGLHYWASPLFRWWQLFTHMFMHGDPYDVEATILHVGFNMFALWMFGRILENLWGPKRFLIFYLVCGLGAALCHMSVLTIEYTRYHNDFMAYQQHPSVAEFISFIKRHNIQLAPSSMSSLLNNPASIYDVRESINFLNTEYLRTINEATVGASGAVFGVLFAFGYLFPNTELMLLFPPIPIKAKWFVGGYALLELYMGLQNSAGDNIAHFAHLGGMLFAFILLKIWNKEIKNQFY